VAAGGKRAGKMIFAVPCGRDLIIKTGSKTAYNKNFCYWQALVRKVTVLINLSFYGQGSVAGS